MPDDQYLFLFSFSHHQIQRHTEGELTVKWTGVVYYARGESIALHGAPVRVAVSKVLGRRGNRRHHQDIHIFEGMVIAVLVASK